MNVVYKCNNVTYTFTYTLSIQIKRNNFICILFLEFKYENKYLNVYDMI